MTTILIIENELAVLDSITALLEIEGFKTVGAKDGAEGVAAAVNSKPNLIICDVMMPELDGYGVLASLRQNAATATIPFIFLTAKSDKADLRQGMEQGADDYITKPFKRIELLNAVNTRLKKQAVIVDHYNTELRQTEKKLLGVIQFNNLTQLAEVGTILGAKALLIYAPVGDSSQKLKVTVAYPSATAADFFQHELIEEAFVRKEASYHYVEEFGYTAYLPLLHSKEELGVLAVLLNRQTELSSNPADLFSYDLQIQLLSLSYQLARVIDHNRLENENARIPNLVAANEFSLSLLGAVSHDLRTPLTAIKNAVAGLKNKELALDQTEQTEYLNLIDSQADRLERLVARLLDLNRIEGGTLQLNKGLYYLPELINNTLDYLAPSPILIKHSFKTNFMADLPLVALDYVQIEQVLVNLIENAAKYSPASSLITINVSQTAATLSGGKLASSCKFQDEQMGVLVEVSDEGIGIPKNEQELVFQKFYRGQNNLSSVKGIGLGLAICRGFIAAHNGQIWARSGLNKGTVIAFWVPL